MLKYPLNALNTVSGKACRDIFHEIKKMCSQYFHLLIVKLSFAVFDGRQINIFWIKTAFDSFKKISVVRACGLGAASILLLI